MENVSKACVKAFKIIFSITDILTIILAFFYYLGVLFLLTPLPYDLFLEIYYRSVLSDIFGSIYVLAYILIMMILNTIRAIFILKRRNLIMMCVTWGIVFSAFFLMAFFSV